MTAAQDTGDAARRRVPAEDRATKQFLDDIASEVLLSLGQANFFGGRPGSFPAAEFHALAGRVNACFEVPDTAITTITARVFYGIAASLTPAHTVGVGTYFGNGLVWLCGGRLPPDAATDRSSQPQIIACDIDPVATEGARRNFASLGCTDHALDFRSEEGVALLRANQTPIDLLYIDIDDPLGERKAGYVRILEAALPRLSPGAVVIAHDRSVARFADDFEAYMAFIRASGAFRTSLTLPIDSYGMELTLL